MVRGGSGMEEGWGNGSGRMGCDWELGFGGLWMMKGSG